MALHQKKDDAESVYQKLAKVNLVRSFFPFPPNPTPFQSSLALLYRSRGCMLTSIFKSSYTQSISNTPDMYVRNYNICSRFHWQ